MPELQCKGEMLNFNADMYIKKVHLWKQIHPTNNAILINIRLISIAEISSMSMQIGTERACKNVCAMCMFCMCVFQLNFHSACHRCWLGIFQLLAHLISLWRNEHPSAVDLDSSRFVHDGLQADLQGQVVGEVGLGDAAGQRVRFLLLPPLLILSCRQDCQAGKHNQAAWQHD